MYKIDLHTHSSHSPDGGISTEQYTHVLSNKVLNYIAITDHDVIDLALSLHAAIGDSIIVGQEITTLQGEIIGLFLTKRVAPDQDVFSAISDIKKQGGLVYIPHPFETIRKGLSESILDEIAPEVDIVEVHNGRAVLQDRAPKALTWARLHNKVSASSSDAHGVKGLGKSYSLVNEIPTKHNLVSLLAKAHYSIKKPSLRSLLYPKTNRLKKRLNKD